VETIVRQGWWQGEAWNRRKDGSHFAERIAITTVPAQTGAPHPVEDYWQGVWGPALICAFVFGSRRD